MSDMKTTSLAAFASQLRAWRQQMGWTQVEAADKLGYSASLVSAGCLQGRRLAGTVSDRCWQGCCVRGGAEAAGPVGQRPGRLMVSPG